MKGHLKKRSKDSWTIVVDLGLKPEGKRNQKWKTIKGTKKEAQDELAKMLSQYQEGTYIERTKITVAEYLDHWLDSVKGNVTSKTFERYFEICRDHVKPTLGQIKLSKLQPIHVSDLYSKALVSGRKDGQGGLSKRSVLHIHRIFRAALQQAVKWQILVRNPCNAVAPPKPETKERLTFTTEETLKVLEKAQGTCLYLPVLLAVTTGMRRGEIIGLRWKDIDLKNKRLSVRQVAVQTKVYGVEFKEPKTQKSVRTIALPDMTVLALKQHKAEQAETNLQLGRGLSEDTLLFETPVGIWAPDQLTATYKRFNARHKLKRVTFHDLRHTHATHLLEQNIHPKIVSERLGHSTIALTLDTYSHVLPNMQEEAASVTDKLLKRTN